MMEKSSDPTRQWGNVRFYKNGSPTRDEHSRDFVEYYIGIVNMMDCIYADQIAKALVSYWKPARIGAE